MRFPLIIALLSLIGFPFPALDAEGSIIFSQALRSSQETAVNSATGSNLNIQNRFADNFRISSDKDIDRIEWYGCYPFSNGSDFIPGTAMDFTIRFHANDGGVPGSLLLEQTVSALGVDTGLDLETFGGVFDPESILKYGADLGSVFSALANVDYWVSIAESDVRTAGWRWARSDDRVSGDPLDGSAEERFAGPGQFPWSSRPVELAFTLHGDDPADMGAVPEPAAWAVWSLLGLGAFVRRRKLLT